MKRIIILTAAVLLIFVGCTRQTPQPDTTSTAPTAEETAASQFVNETSETSIEEAEASQSIPAETAASSSSAVTSAVTDTTAATAAPTVPHTYEQTTSAATNVTTKTTVQKTTAAKTTNAPKTTAATNAAQSSHGLNVVTPTSAHSTVQTTTTADPVITVNVMCSCKNAVDYGIRETNGLIPENGIIFSTDVTVKEGSTALDAIKEACKQSSVSIDESRGYIRGICGLYEKDCGGASGWLYSVNGTFPNTSSNKYVLEPGDSIELHYTVKNGDVTRM